MPRAFVSSSITHHCVVLVFASLFPYLCILFSAVDVILNWLRFFINFVYSLCSFSTHFVFVIKLELVILFWGSKRSWCILHYLNFQLVSKRVHSLWFDNLSVILDPFVLVAAIKKGHAELWSKCL